VGFPTKVQLIKRKTSEQWYVNFPSALAQALNFERGEVVEWIVEDRGLLLLRRTVVPPSPLKKKAPTGCSSTSKPSGSAPEAPSPKSGFGDEP